MSYLIGKQIVVVGNKATWLFETSTKKNFIKYHESGNILECQNSDEVNELYEESENAWNEEQQDY